MNVLEIRHLRRGFSGRAVVDDVSLTLRPGDRTALLGPNGSGKSTVLRCAAGSILPNAGSITVHGHASGSIAARMKTGVSFAQERAFYLRLSGHENLLIFSRLRHGRESEAVAQVHALEEELGIRDIARERADRCSSGMLQQLSFARALLGSPRLLLLDEPTRSLDAAAVERLWSALEDRPEMSVLMATHSDEDIARCDQRLEMGLRDAQG